MLQGQQQRCRGPLPHKHMHTLIHTHKHVHTHTSTQTHTHVHTLPPGNPIWNRFMFATSWPQIRSDRATATRSLTPRGSVLVVCVYVCVCVCVCVCVSVWVCVCVCVCVCVFVCSWLFFLGLQTSVLSLMLCFSISSIYGYLKRIC